MTLAHTRRVARHAGVIAGLVLLAHDVNGQTAADLFDRETLQEIRLFINTRDLAQLRADPFAAGVHAADLQWRDRRVRNVAVRSAGLASRSPNKLALLVEFDRYTSGQRFLGLRSLKLDNLYTDPSMLRERLAFALFERMGQPVPRESFGRLFINNEYEGLYSFVEPIDADYLARVTGDSSRYLFEFHHVPPPFAGEFLGEAPGAYKPRFEARTHEQESDEALYGPIRDLFREVNSPLDAGWRDRVEPYLELAPFVTFVAIEVFTAEVDGLTGTAGMANFYLDRPVGTVRHRFLAWDRDTSAQQVDMPIFALTGQNTIVNRALGFADLRSLFLDVLAQCARIATQDGWWEAEAVRAAALISVAAHEDARKAFSNEALDQATAFVVDFTRRRSAFVLQDVARAR